MDPSWRIVRRDEEVKLPRPRWRIAAEYGNEWQPLPPQRAQDRSHARRDVEPSLASRSRNVLTDRIATSGEWMAVLENREMSKQPPTETPDENPRDPAAPRRLDVPDESLREEFEWVDHSDSEEEPDGYGHGVCTE